MKRVIAALACWAGLSLSAEAATLDVFIFDDGFGSETAFEVVDKSSNAVVFSIGYGTIPDFNFDLNQFSTTLAPGDYRFTILDFFGDGIIAPGGYGLALDRVLILDKLTTGFTGFSESFDFTVSSSQAVPIPAAAPLFLAGLAGAGAIGRQRRRANAAL
ncbi:MAG: VPLPA-CTERM sorting domain-containing protein [Pseudomonadota bacterium]